MALNLIQAVIRSSSATIVRQFLELTSYYHIFIHQFAKIAAPLHTLMHKDVKFEWIEECEQAFETLKESLTHLSVLQCSHKRERDVLLYTQLDSPVTHCHLVNETIALQTWRLWLLFGLFSIFGLIYMDTRSPSLLTIQQ